MDKDFEIALLRGDLEQLKYFIENGQDIHANGDSPLHCATRCGYVDVVKYLVENGANIDDFVIKLASDFGYVEIIEILTKKISEKEQEFWKSKTLNNHNENEKHEKIFRKNI